jgi:RNA polymerase-interacting CarD/CdnL/TRCF family regulator
MFEIGDKVVHPQHGVGQVVKLEDREFERGDSRRYYEIHIPGGSTVWVPVDLSNSVRQSVLVEHLKQGTLAAQCEVVRDLSAFVAHKPSYGTITAFLEAMLRVLCQEWAIVQEISMSEAMAEISSLLEQTK